MKDFYWESDREYFKVPYQVILDKVTKLCKEYGIVTDPEDILDCGMKELFDENGNLLEDYAKYKLESGMKELFDENGNLLEDYAKYKLEKGKELGMFGNTGSEGLWASHLGD